MQVFKADLHIHTILSPCASLDMSPKNIVRKALEQKLDIIGITDHNSTLQCAIVTKEALASGLKVYPGVEITTKEEIHCLAYFRSLEVLSDFQALLDKQLPDIKNNTSLFGYQVVVDENESIVYEEDRLLISALNIGIDKVEALVHEHDGIFIPAHVNKPKDSLTSQLGFIPSSLKADAYELTRHMTISDFRRSNPKLNDKPIMRNSDAHVLDQIGENVSSYRMVSVDFNEFRMALKSQEGREVIQ